MLSARGNAWYLLRVMGLDEITVDMKAQSKEERLGQSGIMKLRRGRGTCKGD